MSVGESRAGLTEAEAEKLAIQVVEIEDLLADLTGVQARDLSHAVQSALCPLHVFLRGSVITVIMFGIDQPLPLRWPAPTQPRLAHNLRDTRITAIYHRTSYHWWQTSGNLP